jgi:hypothetical protein
MYTPRPCATHQYPAADLAAQPQSGSMLRPGVTTPGSSTGCQTSQCKKGVHFWSWNAMKKALQWWSRNLSKSSRRVFRPISMFATSKTALRWPGPTRISLMTCGPLIPRKCLAKLKAEDAGRKKGCCCHLRLLCKVNDLLHCWNKVMQPRGQKEFA